MFNKFNIPISQWNSFFSTSIIIKVLTLYLLLLFTQCSQAQKKDFNTTNSDIDITPPMNEVSSKLDETVKSMINEDGNTIEERFLPPLGFERIKYDAGSFAEYLRKEVPLKPYGAPILSYSGYEIGGNYHLGVIDLPIGKRNLHQCADAVMRMRAEYLYSQNRFDEIHFNFTNGMRVDFSEWVKGNRIKVSGNKTWWVQSAQPSNDRTAYWSYMERIFEFAGTLSLSKELESKPLKDMHIGDVLIQGGSPGHAVLIVDMVENPETHEKLFMLAQSYMPAQEMHILVNYKTNEPGPSPWYFLHQDNEFHTIQTPSWDFTSNDLKQF